MDDERHFQDLPGVVAALLAALFAIALGVYAFGC